MITPAQIKIIGIGLALALMCYLSYDYGATSVQSDWNEERTAINAKTADALITLNKQREEMETELKLNESDAWSKYQDAQIENERLNTELVNTPWRVRVERETCDSLPSNTNSTSMGDGGKQQYAELSRTATASVIAIGKRADQCEAKLAALQGFINTISKQLTPTNK